MKFDLFTLKKLKESSLLARIGYAIPFIALSFVGFLAWRSWRQLPNYSWSWGQLWWLAAAFGLYPLSLGIMLFNWQGIMRNLGAPIDRASNLYIYCLNVAARRLPMGLFWSAGGRMALYSEAGVKAKISGSGVFWEFVLHGLSAFLVWVSLESAGYGFIRSILQLVPPERFWLLAIVGLVGVVVLAIYVWRWQQRRDIDPQAHLSVYDMSGWGFLYGLTWVNAGVMLWLLSRSMAASPVAIERIIAIWSFVGVIGYLFSTLPFIDAGTKEISLALVLSQFMPLSQAVLIAIVFRLLLTISDIIWPMVIALGLRHWRRKQGASTFNLTKARVQ